MSDDEGISARVATIMAARSTFKAGDRVRGRLSGECQALPSPGATAKRIGVNSGHSDLEDGLVGRVHEEPPMPERCGQGHTVLVVFEKPPRAFAPCIGASYAPTELELIAPAPAPMPTEDMS